MPKEQDEWQLQVGRVADPSAYSMLTRDSVKHHLFMHFILPRVSDVGTSRADITEPRHRESTGVNYHAHSIARFHGGERFVVDSRHLYNFLSVPRQSPFNVMTSLGLAGDNRPGHDRRIPIQYSIQEVVRCGQNERRSNQENG